MAEVMLKGCWFIGDGVTDEMDNLISENNGKVFVNFENLVITPISEYQRLKICEKQLNEFNEKIKK